MSSTIKFHSMERNWINVACQVQPMNACTNIFIDNATQCSEDIVATAATVEIMISFGRIDGVPLRNYSDMSPYVVA